MYRTSTSSYGDSSIPEDLKWRDYCLKEFYGISLGCFKSQLMPKFCCSVRSKPVEYNVHNNNQKKIYL